MIIGKKFFFKTMFGAALLLMSYVSFAQVMIDKVVAIVNSQVITQAQVDSQMKMMRNQMQASGEVIHSESELRQKVLDQLINVALQLDVAKKAHITVNDAQLNEAISTIASQNRISVSQLIQSIEEHGITEKAYRDQIRHEIILHEVQQKIVLPQVKVSNEDLADSSNTVHAVKPQNQINAQTKFHVVDILFSTEKSAQDGLSALREKRNQLKKLDDVRKILQQSSIKVNDINDLGIRKLTDFPDIFVSAVKSLHPLEFSSPIKAPNGVHLLLLVSSTGKYGASTPPMTPEQKAFQNKFNQALQNWLLKLRNQSYIKIMSND
jgi:peptidyl-prolyl cis-trans isomerase SurA